MDKKRKRSSNHSERGKDNSISLYNKFEPTHQNHRIHGSKLSGEANRPSQKLPIKRKKDFRHLSNDDNSKKQKINLDERTSFVKCFKKRIQMPYEILIMVFSNIPIPYLLIKCSLVCSEWKMIVDRWLCEIVRGHSWVIIGNNPSSNDFRIRNNLSSVSTLTEQIEGVSQSPSLSDRFQQMKKRRKSSGISHDICPTKNQEKTVEAKKVKSSKFYEDVQILRNSLNIFSVFSHVKLRSIKIKNSRYISIDHVKKLLRLIEKGSLEHLELNGSFNLKIDKMENEDEETGKSIDFGENYHSTLHEILNIFPKLRSLYLSGYNQICKDLNKANDLLQRIQVLHITNSNISSSNLADILGVCNMLNELNISNCNHVHGAAINPNSHLHDTADFTKTLRILNIHGCREIDDEDVYNIVTNLIYLDELDISMPTYGLVERRYDTLMNSIGLFSKLKYLNLRGNRSIKSEKELKNLIIKNCVDTCEKSSIKVLDVRDTCDRISKVTLSQIFSKLRHSLLEFHADCGSFKRLKAPDTVVTFINTNNPEEKYVYF